MRHFAEQAGYEFPQVQVSPEPERLVLMHNQNEMAVYDMGLRQPKPFIFPFNGPSGVSLTRYGHPNPQSNHDHHRSIWFGHQFVRQTGVTKDDATPRTLKEWNFWGEPAPNSDIKIRHTRVLALEDTPKFGGAAVESVWWAGGGALLRQITIYAIVPLKDGEHAMDVQTELHAVDGQMIELGQSNFGLMGVRVAKTISEQFGGGRILNSEGAVGEPAIFGKTAKWVDYSGPTGPDRQEGVCYMDHPDNPRHPTGWHVRRDGWMIASITMNSSWSIATDHPLKLRYRLLAHKGSGLVVKQHLEKQWADFAAQKPYELLQPKGKVPQIVQ